MTALTTCASSTLLLAHRLLLLPQPLSVSSSQLSSTVFAWSMLPPGKSTGVLGLDLAFCCLPYWPQFLSKYGHASRSAVLNLWSEDHWWSATICLVVREQRQFFKDLNTQTNFGISIFSDERQNL